MKRQYQTIADYAALAIAPFLIFWMLTSLAGFLMLVLYQGNYSQRVMWTLMCYTMGATALARLTIEESRSYSSIYATALGVTTFFVMMRFVGDPIFSAAIIFTIGYLADRIVHDCTIVDDGIDSSGQGLVDSGRRWIENQWAGRPKTDRELTSTDPDPRKPEANPPASDPAKSKKAIGRKGHQPGRTVLYLAFGALPLFGIGQFFLRANSDSWQRAKWMLALYLFTSLSLLVVTSFLNLRRYLRQRHTEMSTQVTVSWLAGGVVTILMVLLLAFIAPLPGQAIISFTFPEFLKNGDRTLASRFGWGEEGADQPREGASPKGAPRPDAEEPDHAPESSSHTRPGAPPGGNQGKREDGPAGKESGGKKNSKDSAEQKPASSPSQPKSQTQSETDNRQGEAKERPSDGDDAQPDAKSAPKSNESGAEKRNDQSADNESAPPQSQTPPQGEPQPQQSPPPPPATDWSGMLAGVTGLIKFLLFAALLLVIAFYVYLNREALMAWYQGLFGGGTEDRQLGTLGLSPAKPAAPVRPFSSFANPVGNAAAAEVVVVTFQALEAWGREQGLPRREDETPSEYTRRLAVQFPNLARSAVRVVDAYNRVVYGRARASRDDVNAASSVWNIMRPQL